MKNEDRIVELLAEFVLKADRQEALLAKLIEGQVRHEKILSKQNKKLTQPEKSSQNCLKANSP